jgi:hypothetical protein
MDNHKEHKIVVLGSASGDFFFMCGKCQLGELMTCEVKQIAFPARGKPFTPRLLRNH